jgi:oligopeptide/dipeptide ABC transporter ATP-binding protein
MTAAATDTLLRVESLSVTFGRGPGAARAVRDVSFGIPRGETVGLVGESGCGKSVTSLAVLGLVPPPGRVEEGGIRFDGRDLRALAPGELRGVRGAEIAMIFQEPMTSLNPVYTIGNQVVEALRTHERVPESEARRRARDGLAEVGIPNPDLALRQYPHELSGGMKQRAMIAMALVCRPKLLIADEPTTALDVTIQAQILDLLRRLQAERGMSMLFITHDLGVVAEVAHRVCVMYAGRIVETAATADLYAEPLHPYTIGLFRSLPRLQGTRETLYTIPGQVPNPARIPPGCPFHPRCERAMAVCREVDPPLEEKAPGRRCACHDVPARSPATAEGVAHA